MKGELLKARVNTAIGILFVGSFALWATIMILQFAFNQNPIADAFIKYNLVTPAGLDN
jgi:hypothetical protein